MKTEIRKLLTGYLLSWAFDICPDGEFKTKFGAFLKENIFKL